MLSLALKFRPAAPLTLPLAKARALQGVFYKWLSVDPSLADRVHNKGEYVSRPYKFFCFSDLQGAHTVRGRWITYTDEITWEIRSAENEIVFTIVEAIKKQPLFELNGVICEVSDWNISDKRFSEACFLFSMSTPVTVYETEKDGHRRFFSPDHPRFCDALSQNLKRKYESYTQTTEAAQVKIHLKATASPRKCITRYKNSIIEAYYGEFELIAPPEVISFAYHSGLGAKNSQGFGTISA